MVLRVRKANTNGEVMFLRIKMKENCGLCPSGIRIIVSQRVTNFHTI